MMTMIIIHSFHKLSLKPIKALVLLNPQSSVVVSKHICSDRSHMFGTETFRHHEMFHYFALLAPTVALSYSPTLKIKNSFKNVSDQ